MDDASRLLTHSAFCLGETALDIEGGLKQALLKRGVPRKLVVDNGTAYRSGSLQGICCIFWTIVGTDSDASWAVILIDRGHPSPLLSTTIMCTNRRHCKSLIHGRFRWSLLDTILDSKKKAPKNFPKLLFYLVPATRIELVTF